MVILLLPSWWQPNIPTWTALGLAIGALVLTALIETRKHPRLSVVRTWFPPDTIATGFKWWHVEIANQGNGGAFRWICRDTGSAVMATVEFFENGNKQSGDLIRCIWSERPRPLRDDLVVESQRADIVAGESWNIPVVYKMKGKLECHPFDARNYAEVINIAESSKDIGGFMEVPGRALPEGDYSVRLILRSGSRRVESWFVLSNRTDELGTFSLEGPRNHNPLSPKTKLTLPNR